MRHRTSGRQLGRNSSHRRALFRNLVTALLIHERIETTQAKGKELRAIADRMITLGLAGDLASRRAALAYVQDPKAVVHLFSKIAPLFKTEGEAATTAKGGYTRLIKTRIRLGDAAPMVIVEFTRRTESEVEAPVPDKKAVEPAKAKAGKKAAVAS
jgi:large subunit ribosomal protein L17